MPDPKTQKPATPPGGQKPATPPPSAIFTDSACRKTHHKTRRPAEITREEAWKRMVTNQDKESDSAGGADSKSQQPEKPAPPPPLKIPLRQTIIKPR
jgi:hypothetical protein